MQTITDIYKIGNGPSSSHTMGPQRAALFIKNEFFGADEFKIILYGSLAFTGKGHLTDVAITRALEPFKSTIVYDTVTPCPIHPNTMDFIAFKEGKIVGTRRVYSIGGGEIRIEGQIQNTKPEIYPHNSFKEIKEYCKENNLTLPQYIDKFENPDYKKYLSEVWDAMEGSIREGLSKSGTLPGPLKIQRNARSLYYRRVMNETPEITEDRVVCAYAYAVAETNASAGTIVTAPTCGSSGVLPAVLKYTKKRNHLTKNEIVEALATAGLIGNLIKTNASISGADCGCQAEIGSACAMAAAAAAQMENLGLDQIEYAAEIALEHHLGLTCDPVMGIVQIPCIERNAVAAMRAINAKILASFLIGSRKISLDMVIKTMYETGKDINIGYRETAGSGLAKLYR